MFNRKRQLRECISQVVVFDTVDEAFNVLKTKGVTVQPRKDHCAAIHGNSMIVYGGQYENGTVTNEMLNLDLQFHDWSYIYPKGQTFEPFFQAECATVTTAKKVSTNTGTLEQ